MSSGSAKGFSIHNVHISIRADDTGGAFSKPGTLLWQADFPAGSFTLRDYDQGDLGWFDPSTGDTSPGDDRTIYQVNMVDIPGPFTQQQGTVYWLDLTVLAVGAMGPAELGWTTSLGHYRDDAVWREPAGPMPHWQRLLDPVTAETLDLAFVITPEPVTIALLGLGAAALLRPRRPA